MNKKIDISPKTVITTVATLFCLYLIFRVLDILLGVFIAFILMTGLNPLVNKLEERRVPRSVGIWIVFVIFLGLIITLFAMLIPSLVKQTTELIALLDINSVSKLLTDYGVNLRDLSLISQHLSSLPRVISVVGSTFSTVFTGITILMITFYLLLERKRLHYHIHWFFGDTEAEKRAEEFVNRVESQIGRWVSGQIALMTVIGITTYVGLTILGISSALPLAILAGLFEILPTIGPIISAVPAVILAFLTTSPLHALLVTILYILIQQLENTLIVPQIMRSAVGIHPILTILLLLIGARLGGIPGAILAVPIYLVFKITVLEFYKIKHGRDLMAAK